MSIENSNTEIKLDQVLQAIEQYAQEISVEVYIVGGFVRDQLLGNPSKDIDLVALTDNGVELLAKLARHFSWSRPQTFERFGTSQIRGDGFIIEMVRARAESYDPDSRKPDVKPGTLEEDIWRRDFTVNALCQNVNGKIIDLTGQGLTDLEAKLLRTPLNAAETFSEDPLRMFRAARFVAQLGFTLSDGIIEAMQQQAKRASIVSIERVAEELRRLLISPHPRDGMMVLKKGGLLEVIFPEAISMIGVEQSGFHTYDVFDHTMHALDYAPDDLITRAATLLHDIGKPSTHSLAEDGRHTFYRHADVGADMSKEILTRWRFANGEIESVGKLVKLHLRPIQYQDETFSDSAVRRLIRDCGELRGELLALAKADTKASSYPNLDNLEALERRMEQLDQGGEVSRYKPPLGGEAIMRLAGRSPGPWIGKIQRALDEAVLEGQIPTNDPVAAEKWLHQHPELWQTP